LYINGTYFVATGPWGYGGSGTFAVLFIGYSGTTCATGNQNIAYQGSIDEVYIHSRELAQADVTALANP
jgi:D-aminopeptidase